jgi:simple sugar transport system ATP-binding protein
MGVYAVSEYVLQMKNVTKVFGSVVANKDVNLSVKKGEVHALLGENGAGKSTLMNCLYGMFDSFEGEVFFDNKPIKIKDSKQAIALGIGMVHQHFMLIPALTVIENVVLGLRENKNILDLKTAAKEFTELGKRYNMEIDPWSRVEQLSVGQQQRLEILKALYRKAKLLILDEPTAVLTPGEIESLFDMMRQLSNEGHTVIFITHKLGEVMKICDRCTVLRLGEVVETLDIDMVQDTKHLAALMVGRDVELETKLETVERKEQQLKVKNLSVSNDRDLPAVKNVSFEVYGGEILGICGVDGNGQTELIQCITGLRKSTSGEVIVGDVNATDLDARKILKMNVSHIPEDRHKFGMIGSMTLDENLILVSYKRNKYSSRGFLKQKWIAEKSNEIIKNFNVKTPSIKELAKNLSGGNQQKLVVGRELDRNPQLLIAVHPSRGLDIGATKYIQQQIVAQRDRGAAVLLVSTELDELIELSDRILVIYEGEIMGVVDRENASREVLGPLMAGVR